MDVPIHAAENVDKGETVPRLIAAAGGVLIIAIVAGVLAVSGYWNPPPTAMKTAAQHTQTETR